MIWCRFLILFGVAVSCVCAKAEVESSILTVFQKRCVQCHGEDGKEKGKVNLLKVESAAALVRQPELLGSLIDVIDFEEMPPEDEPQLGVEERAALLNELKALREQMVSSEHTPMRRMNRFQYDNAVVDLFKLKGVVFSLPERMMREHNNYFKPETGEMAGMVTVGSRPLGKSQLIERRLGGVAPFPQDLRAEHGYDNRGDHLSLSPLLMESFLRLGQSIVESDDFNLENVGIWKSFFARPEIDEGLNVHVRQRMERFLTRAFRRPAERSLLDRYVGFVIKRLNAGVTFPDAMKSVAAAVLSSPKFLYLYNERSLEDGSQPVDAFELASRLSFLLWGSIPDQELLDVASSGALTNLEAIEAQFTRMLKDQKLKRFCDSFPTQWLQLERIISSAPNREKFPDFYFLKYRDSMHMMLEPLLIFETVLIENQPITQLIDSDFTYRSSLLQKAYGDLALESDAKGGNQVVVLNFHRMPVTDRRSGGVITNAAVMTMTSGPERTQPITRGAWVAGVIFNNPPEPPPANVPVLGEKPPEGEELFTLRERLSMHRERADCRGCHEQIDPLGFALENYDPIGNWRTNYENGRDVDMSGILFRKHPFGDVIAFKDAILAEKDRFARGLAGHLLSFALARELGPADQIALDQIVERTAADDYRIQALLKQVVLSKPFRTKTSLKTK
ncbi:DUF1592 domain-containing protein [Verrucomicrobiales bacterium]|nr:DUF1592 domain-containing protein [Verrucomicrobiales bacterium]